MGFPNNGKKSNKVSRMMAHCILTKDQSAQTRVAPNSEAKFETEYHDTEDEEKTISDDDYSCNESDADDEVIVVMSGDDSETVSDVENEEQNIEDLSDEENNIVWGKHVILLKIGQRLGELSDQGGVMTSGHIYEGFFFSNNNDYPLTVRGGSNSNLKYLGGL